MSYLLTVSRVSQLQAACLNVQQPKIKPVNPRFYTLHNRRFSHLKSAN